jgi:hypothetical protein
VGIWNSERSGIRENPSVSKISKASAGYLPRKYIDLERLGTQCSKCRDYIKRTGECVITIDPAVSGREGTCTQFLPGIAPQNAVPLRIVPKSIVGYIEGPEVPTYCGRCEYYENERSRTAECAKVGDSEHDTVEYGGCCNHYEVK